jgi:trypsin
MHLRLGTALTAVLMAFTGTAVADPGTQVVGGTRASTKDNPFAVYLVITGKITPVCGGSIVAPNKILTAAHCVDDESGPEPKPLPPGARQVVAGRDDFRSTAGVVANIKKIVLHPKYDGIAFDFAVLTLDRNLPHKSIPLAGAHDSGLVKPGKHATVLGWGDTSEGGDSSQFLLKASIPFQPDADCTKFFGKDDEGIDIYDKKSMLCASHRNGKIDACQGDSGGPFVAGGKLVGIVQFGIGCARPNSPAAYGRVSAVNAWVKQQYLL